jgi:hypothetical protein
MKPKLRILFCLKHIANFAYHAFLFILSIRNVLNDAFGFRRLVIDFYSCVYLFFCKVCGKLDSVYFFAHNFYFYAKKYTLPAFSIRKVYTIAIYILFQKNTSEKLSYIYLPSVCTFKKLCYIYFSA